MTYAYFIDLTKALDSVDRELLWSPLQKITLPPEMLAVYRQFDDGMSARAYAWTMERTPAGSM